MPKIYIAGKISGDENYKLKFDAAAQILDKLGYAVLNPATLPEGMTAADYMRVCLSMIDSADTVAFLEDYQASPGAMLEYQYCAYIGKPMIMYKAVAKRGAAD